jgi:hypothetical protein
MLSITLYSVTNEKCTYYITYIYKCSVTNVNCTDCNYKEFNEPDPKKPLPLE